MCASQDDSCSGRLGAMRSEAGGTRSLSKLAIGIVQRGFFHGLSSLGGRLM